MTFLASAGDFTQFADLGLSPIALDFGFIQIRWYALAYIIGIIAGYLYLTKMLKKPGAPMAQRHAEDLLFYATLGVIIGGRLGYIMFYKPEIMLSPLGIFMVWKGGMSFHGGLLGVILAMAWVTWRQNLSFLRVMDYVACVAPIGLFLGRIANFINAELWGRATDVPWAVVFPPDSDSSGLPRHPSQLYEAGLEGLLLFVILAWLFWKTDARKNPGLLSGVFALGYGLSRFFVEYFRNPDENLTEFAVQSGLTMGQWLTIPMIIIGLFLIWTSRKRKVAPFVDTGEDATE